MLAIFLLLLTFIKFLQLILKLFLYNSVVIKAVILLICICIFYYVIFIRPIRRKLKLSTLRADKHKITSYRLNTKKERIWNLFILFSYPLIFIFGILYLKFTSTNKSLNLLYFYYQFNTIIKNISYLDILLNISLLLCFIIIYIKFLSYIKNYFKFHFTKRHIFELEDGKTYFRHPNSFIGKILGKYNIPYLDMCFYINEKFHIRKRLRQILRKLFPLNNYIFHFYNSYYIHQILLVLIISYEIVFNHFVISKMFIILPYIFIYELLVRFSKFLDTINYQYDLIMHEFLYDKIYQEFDYYRVGSFGLVSPESLLNAINYVLLGLKDLELENTSTKFKFNLISYSIIYLIVIHSIFIIYLCYLYIYIHNFL